MVEGVGGADGEGVGAGVEAPGVLTGTVDGLFGHKVHEAFAGAGVWVVPDVGGGVGDPVTVVAFDFKVFEVGGDGGDVHVAAGGIVGGVGVEFGLVEGPVEIVGSGGLEAVFGAAEVGEGVFVVEVAVVVVLSAAVAVFGGAGDVDVIVSHGDEESAEVFGPIAHGFAVVGVGGDEHDLILFAVAVGVVDFEGVEGSAVEFEVHVAAAVDAAGGDYAPHEIVKGAVKAVHEYEVDVILVGRKDVLHVLAGKHLRKPGLYIVDASQTIGSHESPIKAIRSKPDSSIVVGLNLVKEGKAAAFVSAGNTGAVFYAALSILGRIKRIERPAIGTILSLGATTTPSLLIDSGANADCRPAHLVQFAQLGNTYARELFGLSSPRIGLLNNGEEEGKGNRLAKESYGLLKQTKLDFIGNIQGYDLARGTTDVIVTDGFTGNIILKTIEGLGANWLYSLVQSGQRFSKAYRLSRQAMHRDMGVESWAKKVDYRESGGGALLGVDGNIVIAHGRSQAKAMMNAIGLAKRMVERHVCQKIKEGMYEQPRLHK